MDTKTVEAQLLLLLSHFSRDWLCVTPQTAAHQAPPSLGFSRQEHWSGLPFPSPMHESEQWKWSHSVVSDSSWPHGLQPTRLLRPWDFPGKSPGVGCHCLLREAQQQSSNSWLRGSDKSPSWAGHAPGRDVNITVGVEEKEPSHILAMPGHAHLCLTPWDHTDWTVAHQAPLSMGFSRWEYWRGLPFPPPEALPDPGIEPATPVSPALQANALLLSHWGSPYSLSGNVNWCRHYGELYESSLKN